MKTNRTLLFVIISMFSASVYAAQTAGLWNWLKPRLTGGFFELEGISGIQNIARISNNLVSAFRQYKNGVQYYDNIANIIEKIIHNPENNVVTFDNLGHLSLELTFMGPHISDYLDNILHLILTALKNQYRGSNTNMIDSIEQQIENLVTDRSSNLITSYRFYDSQYITEKRSDIEHNLNQLKYYLVDHRLYNLTHNIKNAFLVFFGDRLGWIAYEEFMKRTGLTSRLVGMIPAYIFRVAFVEIVFAINKTLGNMLKSVFSRE